MTRMNTSLAATWNFPAPQRALSLAESVSWAGMALPLAACAAIWGIGTASPASVAWLSLLHGAIGTAASAWTVLRFALRQSAPRRRRRIAFAWPRPGVLALYSLMVLQPLLVIAAAMLHGHHASLFGISLPTVLQPNPALAHQVDQLHGTNALLLLTLIAAQITSAVYTLGERR